MAVDPAQVAEGGQDVAAGESSPSSQPQEQRSGGPIDFLRRTFFGGGQEDASGPEDGASEGGAETSPDQPATTPTDGAVTFANRAEFERAVQSEADRKLALIQRRDETRAQRAERLRLAREEPYKLADQVERELTQQEHAESYQAQFVQSLRPVLQIVDADIVAPVEQALPADVRDAVFKAIPPELEGVALRKHIVATSLQALEKHWKAQGAAEAETRLRSNGTIVKQVLAEQRAEREEPELIPAAGVPHRTDMDAILRAGFGVSG